MIKTQEENEDRSYYWSPGTLNRGVLPLIYLQNIFCQDAIYFYGGNFKGHFSGCYVCTHMPHANI